MFALRIGHDMLAEIQGLAKQQQTSRSGIVRQAIARFLEDSEDIALAEKSQSQSTNTKSLSDIRKELGLDS